MAMTAQDVDDEEDREMVGTNGRCVVQGEKGRLSNDTSPNCRLEYHQQQHGISPTIP